ncbi:MAG: ABC transporter permease [Eubacteriales bacterium]|jgi:putative ABC transport system permease protein|nr:ABC transporter permease [Eubacteriales bacterium]
MLGIITGIIEQGLIFGIVALGINISYRILNFPDLSVDGTFPLGAAVTSALILLGVNPWICLLASFFAGVLAGALTGVLNVHLRIKDLLSGILMMTALYSVNYRVVGAPNKFLMGETTIFTTAGRFLPASFLPYAPLLVILLITIVAKLVLDWYLRTKSGFLLKSVGDNEGLVVALAQNPGKIKIIGLAIANGLVALAGSVNCQRIVQFDISSGVGTMVMGLAAVIIGTTVLKKLSFFNLTTKVIIGMIIYKACITIAIASGLQSSDMNFIITVLFVVTLVSNDMLAGRRKERA